MERALAGGGVVEGDRAGETGTEEVGGGGGEAGGGRLGGGGGGVAAGLLEKEEEVSTRSRERRKRARCWSSLPLCSCASRLDLSALLQILPSSLPVPYSP